MVAKEKAKGHKLSKKQKADNKPFYRPKSRIQIVSARDFVPPRRIGKCHMVAGITLCYEIRNIGIFALKPTDFWFSFFYFS